MQGPKSGKLTVKIVEAELKRDTETFSKMDPFCKMFYGGKTYKTAVKQNAGKKPKWGQAFELEVEDPGDEIKFEVHDQDMMSTDLVGGQTYKLYNVIGPGNGMD